MMALITISLLLNIAVLIPVCFGLFRNSAWAAESWGVSSPARGILSSIYLAILIASAVLLWFPVPTAVGALLFVQVVYKVTTPFTVRSWRNPVVVSNLGIALVHTVTLAAIASTLVV